MKKTKKYFISLFLLISIIFAMPVVADAISDLVDDSWIGKMVEVNVQRGNTAGWLLKNVELKKVSENGIVVEYERREQFINRDFIISIIKK